MLITSIIAGIVAGGMLFFAFFMAPMIFTQLAPEMAGSFIRAVFPKYYLIFGALFIILSALLFILSSNLLAALVLVSGLGFIAARQSLMPLINKYSDLASGGDTTAARRFNSLHRTSVILNTLQMLIIFYVFYSLLSQL